MLRGILIREIQAIKRNTNAQRGDVERLADDSEKAFVESPTDSMREAWLATQAALNHMTASAAENKRFFNRSAFYEEGEHTGRLLAKIAHAQQLSPSMGRCTQALDKLLRWTLSERVS